MSIDFQQLTGIRLLEPYTTAKAFHLMECTLCKNQFKATPLSQKQNIKRRIKKGVSNPLGCAECNKVSKIDGTKYSADLENMGVILYEEYKGATTLHQVKCKVCDYVWKSRPGTIKQLNKTYGTNGCPNCEKINKSKPKKSGGDIKTKSTNKKIQRYKVDYVKRLAEIKIQLQEEYKGSKKPHRLLCLNCNNSWQATPISCLSSHKKHKTNGCPCCNNKKKQERIDAARSLYHQRIEQAGFTVNGECRGFNDSIIVTNINCGHQFQSTPSRIIQSKVKCPICNKQNKIKRLNVSSRTRSEIFHETSSDWQKYKSKVSSLTQQNYKLHKKTINPNNYTRGLAGKDGVYHLDHILPVRICFDQGIPPEQCADPSNLQMVKWEENVTKSSKLMLSENFSDDLISKLKHNESKTGLLFEISELCSKEGIIIESDSSIIKPYNLDVYVPKYAIGIKIHDIKQIQQSKIISQKYLVNIHRRGEKKGIRTLQFFSDEVDNNYSNVLANIKHLLGCTDQVKRIHARQCTIQEITPSEKNNFLKRNHIQGADKSNIHLGAFFYNELAAVMTFSYPKIFMADGGQNVAPNSWELSRFATDTSVRIPGIASKLLTYFQRNYQWDEIYSYADKRWSQGNVYDKLGFEEQHHNPPAYWYVVDGNRKHRWGYRKDALKNIYPDYDPNLTEYENMLNWGYDRVWDCGTIKYTLSR